jgi:hypothetical protein
MRSTVVASLLLFTFALAPAQDTKPDKPSICLAIGSTQFEWTKDILEAKTLDALKAVAKEHDCSVTEKDGSVYVVHDPTFGITELERKMELVSDLQKLGVGAFQVLDPNKLSQNTYQYLVAMKASFPGFRDAYEKGDAKMYVKPCLSATFSSGGKKISIDWYPDEPVDKRQELTSEVPDSDAKKIRSLPDGEIERSQASTDLEHLTILFNVSTMGALSKSQMGLAVMQIIVDKIKALKKALAESSTAYLDNLMGPYRDGFWNGTLADGANSVSFNSLSPQAQRALLADVTGNLRTYGFQSEDEALTFLKNSSVSKANYKLAVCYTIGFHGSTNILSLK